MVIPVLPTISSVLHTDQSGASWLLTAYLLAASVTTPIIGRCGDIYGKRRVLVVTLGVLTVGTLLAALASTLPTLIAARVIQGAGGGIFPLAFGIVRDEFPGDRVPGAIGFISATLAIGGGIGTVVAGPVVTHLGIHWLFWTPLPLIVLGVVGTWCLVPESTVRAVLTVNWWSAALLSATLVALLLGLSEAPHLGWQAPTALLLFCAAAGFGLLWWLSERRSLVPLVSIDMLTMPAIWRVNVVAVCFGAIIYGSATLVPRLLQSPIATGYGLGFTLSDAGLLLLPQTVVVFLFGISAGRISRAFGSGRGVLAGCVLVAASCTLAVVLPGHTWAVLLVTLLLGGGFGLCFAGMPNVIVDFVDSAETGVATGINANLRNIGGAIGGQTIAVLLTIGTRADGMPDLAAVRLSFLALAAAAIAAAGTAAFLPRSIQAPLASRRR
jgi:MFS family permease